ncbi:MAG TPA: hypothetical protein VH206_20160 [Xanthobacteraceae bacterium]|jgi:hypothetical protein|nr:hypothetical protein [Xanthobacteraceae bacterium]
MRGAQVNQIAHDLEERVGLLSAQANARFGLLMDIASRAAHVVTQADIAQPFRCEALNSAREVSLIRRACHQRFYELFGLPDCGFALRMRSGSFPIGKVY